MFRTIRRVDPVKLVIFDLDDTLWRGVVAEEGQISSDIVEGWPLGLMETACFLKSRGILLAICSRNDEARITELFDRIGGGRIKLADFAAKRINWRPKHENIQGILEEVHLTPHSAVFVDDNPVERAAMDAAIPEIRTLGAHPYYLRRILLWSPETQVPVITDESSRRTEMVQAQIGRDSASAGMSRQDFLATLNLRMLIREIRSTDDRHFQRSLELINKPISSILRAAGGASRSAWHYLDQGQCVTVLHCRIGFRNMAWSALRLCAAVILPSSS